MVEKLAIRAKSATVKWSVPATYPVGLMKSLSQPKTSFALSSFSGPGVGPPNKTGYWKFEKYIGILQWDLVKTCFYIQGKSLNIGTFFGCKYENNWKVWNQHTLPNNKDFNFATLCLHFCIFNTVEECQIKMTLEYIISLQIFMKAVLEFYRSFKKSFDPTYYNGCFWNFCPKSIWVVKSCLGIWFLHATGVLRDQGSQKQKF